MSLTRDGVYSVRSSRGQRGAPPCLERRISVLELFERAAWSPQTRGEARTPLYCIWNGRKKDLAVGRVVETNRTPRILFRSKPIGPYTTIDSTASLLWEWRDKTDCKHRSRVAERITIELTAQNSESKSQRRVPVLRRSFRRE